MDFGEAHFLTNQYQNKVLMFSSVRTRGLAYTFNKKSDTEFKCSSCYGLGKNRSVSVRNGRVVGRKHPEDGHHVKCRPVDEKILFAKFKLLASLSTGMADCQSPPSLSTSDLTRTGSTPDQPEVSEKHNRDDYRLTNNQLRHTGSITSNHTTEQELVLHYSSAHCAPDHSGPSIIDMNTRGLRPEDVSDYKGIRTLEHCQAQPSSPLTIDLTTDDSPQHDYRSRSERSEEDIREDCGNQSYFVACNAKARAQEPGDENQLWFQRAAAAKAASCTQETENERQLRLQHAAAYKATARVQEKEGKRQLRLQRGAAYQAARRAQETADERRLRLQQTVAYKAAARAQKAEEERKQWLEQAAAYTVAHAHKAEEECLHMLLQTAAYTATGCDQVTADEHQQRPENEAAEKAAAQRADEERQMQPQQKAVYQAVARAQKSEDEPHLEQGAAYTEAQHTRLTENERQQLIQERAAGKAARHTQETAEKRLKQTAVRCAQNEEDKRQLWLQQRAGCQAARQAQETEDECLLRCQRDDAYIAAQRAQEEMDKQQLQRQRDAARKAAARARETEDKRQQRLQRAAAYQAARRAQETEEERRLRRQRSAAYKAARRFEETEDECQLRLQRKAASQAARCALTAEDERQKWLLQRAAAANDGIDEQNLAIADAHPIRKVQDEIQELRLFFYDSTTNTCNNADGAVTTTDRLVSQNSAALFMDQRLSSCATCPICALVASSKTKLIMHSLRHHPVRVKLHRISLSNLQLLHLKGLELNDCFVDDNYNEYSIDVKPCISPSPDLNATNFYTALTPVGFGDSDHADVFRADNVECYDEQLHITDKIIDVEPVCDDCSIDIKPCIFPSPDLNTTNFYEASMPVSFGDSDHADVFRAEDIECYDKHLQLADKLIEPLSFHKSSDKLKSNQSSQSPACSLCEKSYYYEGGLRRRIHVTHDCHLLKENMLKFLPLVLCTDSQLSCTGSVKKPYVPVFPESSSGDGHERLTDSHPGDNSCDVRCEDNDGAEGPLSPSSDTTSIYEPPSPVEKETKSELESVPKNTISCSICGKLTTTRASWYVHMRTHGRFKCSKCSKSFFSNLVLRRHRITCKATNVQENYESGSNSSRSARQNSDSGKLGVTYLEQNLGGVRHECSVCKKSYIHKRDLWRHMQKANHGETNQKHDQGGVRHECAVCQKSYIHKKNLRSHYIQTKHGGAAEIQLLKTERVTMSSSERKHACTICSKCFDRPKSLHRHMMKHDPDLKTYSCKKCGERFRQYPKLCDHRLICLTEEEQEAYPGLYHHSKLFVSKGDILEMEQTRELCATNERMRKLCAMKDQMRELCATCGKLIIVAYMSEHIQAHSGEFPFVCSQCGRGFNRRRNLETHQLTHSDPNSTRHIKPKVKTSEEGVIKREYMPATRRRRRRTKEELGKKRAEAPVLACTYCEKTFKMKWNLKVHIFTHTRKQCSGFVEKTDASTDPKFLELPTVA